MLSTQIAQKKDLQRLWVLVHWRHSLVDMEQVLKYPKDKWITERFIRHTQAMSDRPKSQTPV